MKKQIWVAIAAVALMLGGCGPTDCEGFFTYIPSDRDQEVPFSIEIRPNAVKLQYLDYSNALGFITSRKDGNIEFIDEFSGKSNLHCERDEAKLTFSDEYQSEMKTFSLKRSKGDVFYVGKELGWEWGD
jgi:hypothetical protein